MECVKLADRRTPCSGPLQWTTLGLQPGLRDEKPVTNCLFTTRRSQYGQSPYKTDSALQTVQYDIHPAACGRDAAFPNSIKYIVKTRVQ
jgi:hypothetical protein